MSWLTDKLKNKLKEDKIKKNKWFFINISAPIDFYNIWKYYRSKHKNVSKAIRELIIQSLKESENERVKAHKNK